MGLLSSITDHWFELLQTVGIVCSLWFAAYTTLREERARQVTNLIAANDHYRQIWKEITSQAGLSRIVKREVNLEAQPISEQEAFYVRLVIQHLAMIYFATKQGMFVELEALERDAGEFFSLPIPKTVWSENKSYQQREFAEFVDTCLRTV